MSDLLSQVQVLMQDLGPAMSDIDCIIQQESGQWRIHLTDGLVIDISYCSHPARLMLSAMIGTPDAQSLNEVHITMLCANLIFAEDHSLRVALTHPGGDLMLISEWMLELCLLAEFRDVLLQHADRARYFSDLVAAQEVVLDQPLLPVQMVERI